METLLFLLAAAFLVFLNGFFVLAEFSAVKVRSTQIQVLAEAGNKKALRAQKIVKNLDVYLSVCQVGITIASIGLGFVGEPAFATLLFPLVAWLSPGPLAEVAAHTIAVVFSFVIVSFLHIVLGELLPKSIAIRSPEKSVLSISRPLLVFHFLFAGPIWLLNSTVNGLLRLLRFPVKSHNEAHSDGEIRAILDHSEASGVLSFRSLLLLENVLDFGSLTIRNAMRVRRLVHTVSLPMDRAKTLEIMAQTKHSRYPVLSAAGQPVGFLHAKDVLFSPPDQSLDALIRPTLAVAEADSLEKTLATMQRRGQHLVLVYNNAHQWTGIITLEDIIEELTGTIEEEFPVEPSVNLIDFLTPDQIILDVAGDTVTEAVARGLSIVPEGTLPCSRELILKAVIEREKLGSSYLGHHLAVPHARIDAVELPAVFIFRLATPIPAPTSKEEASIKILFLLISPSTAHRVHQLLLSHIGGMYESDYFEDRLIEAQDAEELYETVATTEQTALD